MIKGSDWGGSRLTTAQTCKQKYFWRYHQPHPIDGGEGLIQKEDKIAPAKGTLLHTCLQYYYQQRIDKPDGPRGEQIVHAMKKMIDQIKDFNFNTAMVPLLQDELIAAADQYFQKYELEDLEPVAVEIPIEVSVPDLKGGAHKHTGIIDLVARWNGSLFVVDHKTTSMTFTYLFKKQTFSISLKGYCRAAAKKYGEVCGALINGIRFKKNKALEVECERDPIMFNEQEMSQFEPTVRGVKREIQMCQEEGFWPKSPEQCCQAWGECEYLPLCSYPVEGMMVGKYKGAQHE